MAAWRPRSRRHRAGPQGNRHEDYLAYRLRTAAYIAERLEALGVPTVKPSGGHAIFVDAKSFLPHIPPLEYPGQSLAAALYLEGGIRSCEIGTVMFGMQRTEARCRRRWSWFASPAAPRLYSEPRGLRRRSVREHRRNKNRLRGLKIVWQPQRMRHFSARFAPL